MISVTKAVKRYGNSGGVYVPSKWIGGRVRVELLEEPLDPRKDVLKLPLEHVVSAILYGSHARKEAAEGSDVDVLLVVDDDAEITVPAELRQKYDIQVKRAGEIRNAVAHDPVLYKVLNDEAVAIINHQFLEGLKKEVPDKKGIRARIGLLESSLAITRELMKGAPDAGDLVYPLVMRLKEILIIECLLAGKKYSTKALEREILSRGVPRKEYSLLMDSYRAARGNKKAPKQKLQKDTAAKLVLLLESKIQYVRQKAREKRH